MDFSLVDRRPIVVAVAGPNGAGKSTFFHSYLADAGLRFINADVLAAELHLEPYQAAAVADQLRRELVKCGESFIFETVFSDAAGDKIRFLEDAVQAGYTVLLCYIGLDDPGQSGQRVAMRVSQGGHDVPDDKLQARFVRSLANLRAAITRLPHVFVYDNSDLGHSFRPVAAFEGGRTVELHKPTPKWLRPLLPP